METTEASISRTELASREFHDRSHDTAESGEECDVGKSLRRNKYPRRDSNTRHSA